MGGEGRAGSLKTQTDRSQTPKCDRFVANKGLS